MSITTEPAKTGKAKQTTPTNIDPLPPEKRKKMEEDARELSSELVASSRKTVTKARELGKILSELKRGKTHGNWRAYLKDKLKIRARNATNYMRIWNKTKNFETLTDYFKSENIDHLGVGGLLRYFADKKQEKKKAEDAERKDILNEDPEVQRNTSDPIKLADGSPLDTRKLNLENGLIDQTSLAKRFTAIKSSDLPGTARVQRVTAHLVGGLNKAVGRKRGAEALDLAEAAAMDLLDLIQATKNNHKTA